MTILILDKSCCTEGCRVSQKKLAESERKWGNFFLGHTVELKYEHYINIIYIIINIIYIKGVPKKVD